MNLIGEPWRYHVVEDDPRPELEPQGKALILELRRLQRELLLQRNEDLSEPVHHRSGRDDPSNPRNRNVAKRSGTRLDSLRRVFAICREALGLGTARAAEGSGSILIFENARSTTRAAHPRRQGAADQRHPAPRSSNPAAPQSTSRLRKASDLPHSPDHSLPDRAEVEPRLAESCAPELPEEPSSPAVTLQTSLRNTIKFCVALLRTGAALVIDRLHRPRTALNGDFSERIVGAYEGELRTALRVLVLGAGILGTWATFVPLSSAVVIPGTLVVQSSVKKVQHPTGGVVADIRVHDGQHVEVGEPILRLDATQVRATRQLLANQLSEIHMRMARLIAERDDARELQRPGDLSKLMDEEGVRRLVTSETSLFNARATARAGQKKLLQNNINQLGEQIAGLESQIKSKSSQLELIASELAGVQELYGKGLVPLTRLTTLQRESARLEGERGQLISAIAEINAKIGQTQLQIVRIDQDFRTEVMKDLRETQNSEAEISEKIVAAQDQLDRIEIRAPTAGIIHQLSVHTVGGVIRPGEVITEIVPNSDNLEIEARLPPQEIDQVRLGQRAFLRFSAFNQRTTPEVIGTVSYVSADLSHDPQTTSAYYTVRINLAGSERRRLNGLTLLSGMPVEAFLQTGSRTMINYLTKPIADQLHRMFNER